MPKSVQVGDVVRVDKTADPKWDGLLCTVHSLTDYGAVLLHRYFRAEKGVGPGVATYRALYHEFRPVARSSAVPRAADAAAGGTFEVMVVDKPERDGRPAVKAKDIGYTGDVCPSCQGSKMRRNGSCLLCEDCGSTTGCS